MALSGLLAGGCAQSTPSVAFESMVIQKLDLAFCEYLATCKVDNPNAHPMQIEDVSWTLFSGQTELTRGNIGRSGELPPDKATPLRIYITVPRQVIDRAGLGQQRQFDYRLTGLVRFGSPLGQLETTFQTSGRMPVINPLEPQLVSIEHLGTSETRVGVAVTVRITNCNDLSLTPTKFDGFLLIDDRPLVELSFELDRTVPIGPGQSVELRIPVWVTSPELGVRSLARTMTAPNTDFALKGDLTLRMPGTGDVNDLLAGPTATGPATQPEAGP